MLLKEDPKDLYPTGNPNDDVQMMNEDEFNSYYDNQDWKVVDIDDEYDDGIVEYYTDLKSQGTNAKNGDYNPLTNNCTLKAQEALEYAGLDIETPLYWYTPDGLYQYFNAFHSVENLYKQYVDSNYSSVIQSIDSVHSGTSE